MALGFEFPVLTKPKQNFPKIPQQEKKVSIMIFLTKGNHLVEDRSSGSMKFTNTGKQDGTFESRKRSSKLLSRFSLVGKNSSKSKESSKTAIQEVMQAICVQRDNRDALQRYIERKTDSVVTHLQECNELGAIYAMRKLLLAQAEKDFTLQAIGQLSKLILEIQLEPVVAENYRTEVDSVLSKPATSVCNLDDDEFVLEQAKKCFQAVSHCLER